VLRTSKTQTINVVVMTCVNINLIAVFFKFDNTISNLISDFIGVLNEPVMSTYSWFDVGEVTGSGICGFRS
jgi:hypothetical protein